MNLTEWHLKITENVNAVMGKMGTNTASQITKMDALQKSVGGLGGAFSALSGVVAAVGIGSFISKSIDEFQQAAAANAQLKASYLSTNAAVGNSYSQLLALSDKLSQLSVFDDDDITKAQSVLLTFTNIKGQVYNEALPAIADLSSKMGTDLQSSVLQIGKALNDPIEGISALFRVGVSFTEQQKQIIKHYVDIGQTAKAQQLIIAELNTEFGGSAKAALDAQPMLIIHKQFQELQETVGKLAMTFVVKLKPAILGVIEKMSTGLEWITEHWDSMKYVIGGVALAIGTAGVAWAAYTVYTNIATAVTGALTAAQWLLNIALNANPIGLIVIGIAALIGAVVLLWKKFDWFRGAVTAVFEGLKAYVFGWFFFMKDILTGIGKVIGGIFTGDFSQIAGGLDQAGGAFSKYANGIKNAVVNGYKEGVNEIATGDSSLSKLAGIGSPTGKPSTDPTKDIVKRTTAGNELNKGLNSVSEGGAPIKNINIHIGKLVEGIHVHSTTLRESTSEIKRIVEETIIRAVAGAEMSF